MTKPFLSRWAGGTSFIHTDRHSFIQRSPGSAVSAGEVAAAPKGPQRGTEKRRQESVSCGGGDEERTGAEAAASPVASEQRAEGGERTPRGFLGDSGPGRPRERPGQRRENI